MADKDFVLRREFLEQAIQARIYAAHLAELAVRLAEAAGERVTRPLTAAQIARAVEVNGTETALALDALVARLEQLYRKGELPQEAGVPRW
ncbi:hypothetical protein [Dokdonella sp.]|uniref:hypothetical protein n=1 Tax=Dokdonella sp. TaxID=2291710 RepID=UPI0025C70B3A|nr:hypothetical protein [Dokdonella sp.]MBX3689794.1 hypothetical protein [Dokdonella sp.]